MEQEPRKCKLVLEPAGLCLDVVRGTTVWEAASRAGVRIRAECGGKGLCGKCRVRVRAAKGVSAPDATEQELLSREELQAGMRLACQCRIEDSLEVEVPPEALESEEALGKTSLRGKFGVDPTVKRVVLDGSAGLLATPTKPQALLEQLAGRMAEVGLGPDLRLDLEALRDLSLVPFPEGDLTIVCHKVRGLSGVRAGARHRSLGVAMDLGTTTLAVYICDLLSGQVLATAGAANPQRRFGEDVISRIGFAGRERGCLEKLQRAVIEGLNRLVSQALVQVKADPGDVDEAVVVGNTCMVELFCGLNPEALGRAPYLPVTRSSLDLRAGDVGLEIPAGTNVHVLPVISGFVGADTVSAILADGLHSREEMTLLVDIGTNGEIVLGNSQGLWATSCATGPALEGAHISSGIRAMTGAISRVWQENGRLKWEVLGGGSERPKGICGSGIIDALAVLRRTGVLLPSGRLREGAPGVFVDAQGVGRHFNLVAPELTATGRPIGITLEDVRQVQLAKAALFVGIRFLMRRAGLERVERLVLTGAFGARFDWGSAVDIGMLPQEAVSGRVEVVENAAGLGAILALLDWKKRQEAWQLAPQVQVLELAQETDFALEYPMAMGFPPL